MASHSNEKVCEFLKSRSIEEIVIKKFRSEKMDFVAIQRATDSDLEILGLTRRGDLLALRSFVEGKTACAQVCDERKEKKKKLLQLAKDIQTSKNKGNSNSLTSSETSSFKKEKPCTRKIQVGWLHYNSSTQKYVSIRYSKGGGAREISMDLTAGAKDIINKAKELFFPDGKSYHGDALNMTFSLGRFDCKSIVDENFCLGKYIDQNKLTRVRLYLMSKHDEESSCDELPVAPFDFGKTVTKGHDVTTSGSSCGNGIDGLLGTSGERALFKEQQDQELQRSLEKDQAKDRQKTAEVEILKRQQCLQSARASRVPDIPPPGIAHVIVSIRHPSVGVQTRSFCQLENISAVYDWAGSLALTPESFILSKCDVPETLLPDLPVTAVDKHLLSMLESDNMPSYPGNYIDFLGFGSNEDILEEEIQISWETPNFFETLPHIVVVVGDDHEIVDSSNQQRPLSAGLTASEAHCQNMSDGGQDPSDRNHCSSDGEYGGNIGRSVYQGESGQGSMGEEENTDQGPDDGREHDRSSLAGSEDDHGSTGGSGSNHAKMIRVVRLRRALVLQDLIKEFLYVDILSCQLKIIMVDGQGNNEKGVDSNGIYRDALANFWQEFYISCSLGERERVPFLRHDFQSDQWAAVARIIVKGYLDLGYFPVMLSQAFFISAMFSEKAVSDDILLRSFKRYLAPIDEEVVCRALAGDEERLCDDEDLIELLDRFGCRKLPTKDNIKSLVMEVAHKEIIQQAQYVVDCWEGIFKTTLGQSQLSSVDGVYSLYESLEPTTKKVLAMVDAVPETSAERSALEYLKRFIRGLDIAKLKSFVMFVTGADVICVPTIHVNFTKLEGFERRPIAHTCGCVLELPRTYDCYTELRAEFTNVLSKEKWQNDIL